jgi:hypothetical protein
MASAFALRQLASAKLTYFKSCVSHPFANNGSSKTGCAVRIIPNASNQAVPDAKGASALEQDRCAIHFGEFPDYAIRPEPNVAAASAGLPVRSCSAARLLVDKLFRD